MKDVVAIKPYLEPGRPVFKLYPYQAWERCGGTVRSYYVPRIMHGVLYRCQFPSFGKSDKQAHLCFVQPESLTFDTFPSYLQHEIIPFMWDCWPGNFENVCNWLMRNNVKTAFFTSSQTASLMKQRFPEMNILFVPEGIDTAIYRTGKDLKDRSIDMLFYGRPIDHVVNYHLDSNAHVYKLGGLKGKKLIHTQEDLYEKLSDSKIVAAFPQSMTAPQRAGNIETLTQRYWENMLSRIVMVGYAPKELIDLIGYNPVVELDREHPNEQINKILAHIEDYQSLVDKNRKTALRLGDWASRMNEIMKFLNQRGYKV